MVCLDEPAALNELINKMKKKEKLQQSTETFSVFFLCMKNQSKEKAEIFWWSWFKKIINTLLDF